MASSLKTAKRPKVWRCPDCTNKYTSMNLCFKHVRMVHGDLIPEGMPVEQYCFNKWHKKDFQLCVICKKNKTKFNIDAMRYERFCSPECKKKAGEIAENNLKKKTGKGRKDRLNDPETQRKMLKNRTISGTYTFSDGKTKIDYVGSYELHFLQWYDHEYKGSPNDIMECPFTFDYIFEGKKHVYIPDFYIPTLNLIIEIKDGDESNNTNKAIIETSFKKEKLKDEAVKKCGKFNFIKIRDKIYDDFLEVVQIIAERNESGEEYEPIFVNPERKNVKI